MLNFQTYLEQTILTPSGVYMYMNQQGLFLSRETVIKSDN